MVKPDKQDYIIKEHDLPGQSDTYRILPRDPPNKDKNRLFNMLKSIKAERGLGENYKRICTTGMGSPCGMGTYKSWKTNPIRPIVSSSGAVPYWVTTELANILRLTGRSASQLPKEHTGLCIMFLILLLNQFGRFSLKQNWNFVLNWQAFAAKHGCFFWSVWENVFPLNIQRNPMETYQNCIEQHSFGYSKGKHFPRQTRRSSHVWLRKLVSLEQNFSSVSERTFQLTQDFVEQVKNIRLEDGQCATSYDVKALFISDMEHTQEQPCPFIIWPLIWSSVSKTHISSSKANVINRLREQQWCLPSALLWQTFSRKSLKPRPSTLQPTHQGYGRGMLMTLLLYKGQK